MTPQLLRAAYLEDPTYHPGQSWVAESDARLVAHIRVFDRTIRVGGGVLRDVACLAVIGNVITAPDRRGRGHAGRLREAVLAESQGEGLPYSLLRAHWSSTSATAGRA